MENIIGKEKRLEKMSATFGELKHEIITLKKVKSEYIQASIILLRNVFEERERKQSTELSNCNKPHVINNVAGCKFKKSCGHDYCTLDECPEYEPRIAK